MMTEHQRTSKEGSNNNTIMNRYWRKETTNNLKEKYLGWREEMMPIDRHRKDNKTIQRRGQKEWQMKRYWRKETTNSIKEK